MNYYFLGIAGAGMSALASVLFSEGHSVSGSDDGVFPPISDYLKRLGILYHVGFAADLVPIDLDAAIVGGSAKLELARNPELAEIVRRGVPRYSFPQFLAENTVGRQRVVIAGSFGKSTVTALAAVLMREAGRDPGYFIGAAPLDLATTGHAGSDPVFLIEGDEYIISQDDRRSKFMLYRPDVLMITSLIHDHLNVFPTLESYEAPFGELIEGLPPNATVVCARGSETLRRLTRDHAVVWYGCGSGPGYCAHRVRIGEVTRFDLVTPNGESIPLETELLGMHNIENIVGAAALLTELGATDLESLRRGVRRFRGVARRLDKKTIVSRVPAYEGFGSSYEKARSAIDALALHFPDRPLIVVFEPHTFSWRNSDSLVWYDTVFAGVAFVLILPPPRHGAADHDQLGLAQIVERISAAGVAAKAAADGAEVLRDLAERLAGDEVVLLLSSGPLDGLALSLPAFLDERFGDDRNRLEAAQC